jgi:hypothetical protein
MCSAGHEPGRGFSGTPQVPPCRLASGILASRRPLNPLPGSCLCARPFVWGAGDTSHIRGAFRRGRRLGMGWGGVSPTVWRHGCRRRAYKDVSTACRRRPPPTHAGRSPINYRPGITTAPLYMLLALTLTLFRKRERGLFRPTSSVPGVVPQAGEGIYPRGRCGRGVGYCFLRLTRRARSARMLRRQRALTTK